MKATKTRQVIPDATTEIETKYIVPTTQDLKGIRKAMVTLGHSSALYLMHQDDWFLAQANNCPSLKSHPVSWYIDDNQQSLHHNDLTVRSRFSLVNGKVLPLVQHCVKGHSEGFNGAGGSARYEDEVMHENPRFSTEYFASEKTRTFLADLKPEDLCLYFATDVRRNFIGVADEHAGKKSMLEIAFDNVRYIAPTKSRRRTKIFYKQAEIEIEYVNPRDSKGQVTPLAKALDLSVLSMQEIEDAMQRVAETIKKVAKLLNIQLKPQELSKGKRGYYQLKAKGAILPVPLHLDDALLYFPK